MLEKEWSFSSRLTQTKIAEMIIFNIKDTLTQAEIN